MLTDPLFQSSAIILLFAILGIYAIFVIVRAVIRSGTKPTTAAVEATRDEIKELKAEMRELAASIRSIQGEAENQDDQLGPPN